MLMMITSLRFSTSFFVCDHEQAEQGFGKRIEHASTRNTRPVFPDSVLTIHMGAVQILPLEAMVDLLEKS